MIELEDKMINYELQWWEKKEWILSWINKLAETNNITVCLDESKTISKTQFDQIIKNKDINKINQYLILIVKKIIQHLLMY